MDKSKEIMIENWSIVGERLLSPYEAPETQRICLRGEISEHHTLELQNKTLIQSSVIVEVDGTLVTTYSGTKYRLGTIDQNYLRYLNENHIAYDRDNPIKYMPGWRKLADA